MLGIEYRPKSFKEVIAQTNAVKALQNGITNKTIGSSLAILGPSGVGKSTLARVVAMALQCENPQKDENGLVEPCGKCPHCLDIINGKFNKDILVLNGNDLVQDRMRELEEELSYDPLISNQKIVIIEESQLIPTQSSKSLLVLLEKNLPHATIILTSTSEEKFANSYAKDNSSRERNALRSRLSVYKLSQPTSEQIADYMFKLFATEIDPDGKLPDACMEMIPYIAQNSKGNIRQGLNDMSVMLDSECYNKSDLIELLGYQDDEKESDMVISLLYKDKTALKYISESNDVSGNFNYWYKILSDNALRDMIGEPFGQSWKEKNYAKMKASGNILTLYEAFNRTQQLCGNYFNPNVLISMLYEYYNGKQEPKRLVESASPQQDAIVKKVKKVVAN